MFRKYQMPVLFIISCITFVFPLYAVEYPGPNPGPATATHEESVVTLKNNALCMKWTCKDNRLRPLQLIALEKKAPFSLDQTECFKIEVMHTPSPKKDTINASDFVLRGPVRIEKIAAQPKSHRIANRCAGQIIKATLLYEKIGMEVEWMAELRDGSNYIRQAIQIKSNKLPIEIEKVTLVDMNIPGAKVLGLVDGSPVVSDVLFIGVDNPASKSVVQEQGKTVCYYPYYNAVEGADTLEVGSVVGVYPEKQLRRAFLYYIERERCYPYRAFLHHNNLEQVGYAYYMRLLKDAKDAQAFRAKKEETWRYNIKTVGEAFKKRDVFLDSYVHDCAWDNEKLVWQFHHGYPNGFTPLAEEAAKYHSHVGVWFSPWGGYGSSFKDRMAGGKLQGFEMNQQMGSALSLSGTRYFARFRAAATNMIRDYSVNYFKFDGFAGTIDSNGPAEYQSDFEALWKLLAELRSLEPNVFINTSTGSWPSPFWLMRTDSIWRGGNDTGNSGAKGSPRQQWITYRDFKVWNCTTNRGPLFPISSMMIHGIMLNSLVNMNVKGNKDFLDEIYSFFATGVNLQELYINTKYMNDELWDSIAEAANWSRANTDVLADVHWVGGNPSKLEVYGWAAWNDRKAILSLRNPNDQPARFSIDVAKIFELPQGAKSTFVLNATWKRDAKHAPITVSAGKPHEIELAPFEVLTFDALPK